MAGNVRLHALSDLYGTVMKVVIIAMAFIWVCTVAVLFMVSVTGDHIISVCEDKPESQLPVEAGVRK